MRRITLIILSFILFTNLYAQSPKREFRAAWIATVSNIDWPSKPGLPAAQQQAEFIARLDQLKAMGCNAVIVQVRPACDAFYSLVVEPWSRYLTGKQGQPPFPYYDPLKFMIEETHKRNMEFHAWFNPFRALVIKTKNPNPPDHVTLQHPHWIVHYGTKSYLNPGIPEAREYVIRVITDVVKRYDIDAVHLDDYFYPYRIAGVEFGDAATYKTYGKGFESKDDWRRNNVDLFVSVLNTNIKEIKPYVKLGISPFGVWRNASKDPRGSETRGGQTCYDDLYSDVVLWMQNGWIDYLVPQLYWEHGHRLVAFETLMPWWDAHSAKRHTYYGLGVYRMLNATKPPWNTPGELLWQMQDVRQKTKHPGFVFYSTSNFDKLNNGIGDSVARFNRYIALPPRMPWLDSIAPPPPTLIAEAYTKGLLLKWTGENPLNEKLRFAVYRFEKNEKVDLNKAEKLVSIVNNPEYFDYEADKHTGSKYVVTALDRLWNESEPSNVVTVSAQ
ncbi:MAG: family 10 glycosylhydrolase [Chitinophagales bacterium]|nr:family 10 glycosylhydrolase [Chitinophagaceae bacterium]MCB9064184.1 family 10 glycosylhydrolase [Chitinophagales bacterium]